MPIRSYELDFERIEEGLAAGELRRELESALESLPEEQRDALQLRVVEELPYQQVAVELGCSETAARLRVMRALGKLARLLRAANA
jgi:RNA polymerase sigma-70 factor (ECF subfamily)